MLFMAHTQQMQLLTYGSVYVRFSRVNRLNVTLKKKKRLINGGQNTSEMKPGQVTVCLKPRLIPKLMGIYYKHCNQFECAYIILYTVYAYTTHIYGKVAQWLRVQFLASKLDGSQLNSSSRRSDTFAHPDCTST